MKKTRQQIADWGTINLDRLRRLPTVDLGSYHPQDDAGNGCAGDPPGFPTYYTRAIYTALGNSLPDMVIQYEGINYDVRIWKKTDKSWDEAKARQDALFRELWAPLPLDHPRTVAWIRATFSHHHHCYHAPGFKDWSKDILIWPGGCLGNTPFGRLENVQWEVEYAQKHQAFDKWRPEEQEKFRKDIEESNARITRSCEEVATPDNHDGTILVRRYYPEFNPTPELIAGDFESPGNWWEVMAEKPTPEDCPGQFSMSHPCNGSWCQMCGWHAPKAEVAA